MRAVDAIDEHVYCVAVTFKMTESAEQRICIECYVKLEHSSMETVWMIQKALGEDAMSAAQIKVWHKCLKMAKNLLKVIHVLEGLKQAEHLRMLNV